MLFNSYSNCSYCNNCCSSYRNNRCNNHRMRNYSRSCNSNHTGRILVGRRSLFHSDRFLLCPVSYTHLTL
ncbi:hypothetical protein, partial [uncultured Capnocytophaga sp.]|uniref:hypothetical protein n=1 Tax=uncultured Capnocytophaga sp. TaxID=159273 RepID=UPI00262FD7DD